MLIKAKSGYFGPHSPKPQGGATQKIVFQECDTGPY
jgi:hypothetical protein